MSILSLKVRSFKTYGIIESIPFSPFTCIVGPNGVGKSNLVDALVFGLGANLSEIRGRIAARESPSPTAVEISFRDRNGTIREIKRELVNEVSTFYIDTERVSAGEYYRFLESQNISAVHRNFLISQNESMIKSPKDLTKFIDKISGSDLLKEKYKELKQQREITSKEYHEILERKRAAEVSSREYSEVLEMREKLHFLSSKRRVLASSKIKKRRASVVEAQNSLKSQLNMLQPREESSDLLGMLRKKIATLQTELIKHRAIRDGLLHRENRRQAEAEDRNKTSAERKMCFQKIQENIAEADAQIEECEWKIKKTQEVAGSSKWGEKHEREVLVRTLSEMQRIEESKSILQMKITLNEIKREIKECVAAESEQPENITESARMQQLNKSLLETLKDLSGRLVRRKEVEYGSRLKYLVTRIKGTIPQVLGRIADLLSSSDEKYDEAVNALMYSKKNTIIIEHEKYVLPILTALTQAGAGRVTILPLNRLNLYHNRDIVNENTPCNSSKEEINGYIHCRDIIRVSPDIKTDLDKIVNYVCGNSVVYTGEGLSMDMKRLEKLKVKIITLDGIVISKERMVRKISMSSDSKIIKELEERRDRIIEEIKEEAHRQPVEESVKVSKKSEKVLELEEKYAELQKELECAEEEIRDQIKKVVEKSKIPLEVIKQAKEEGVIDSSSAERKVQQLRKKQNNWRTRLNDLVEQLNKMEKENITERHKTTEELGLQEKEKELNQKIKDLEDNILKLSEQLRPAAEIEVKVLREQIDLLDDEIEEIEQYMAEEGLTPEAVMEAPDEISEEDLEKLEREIVSVSSFLAKKGAVAETREIFLQLEKEAEEKKELLSEIIREFQKIRKDRTRLFLETFDKINSLINKHYAELTENPTGHVRAHLGLENSLEPYLAGTQIFVMPTGKTFREVKYLSGGEKTMVALALLLSIDSIYPSLFYIFDELDAALDKDKISSLKESLQAINAQFIAVTHRLELFETADTLIGVAKPPQGLSQIFTLKL